MIRLGLQFNYVSSSYCRPQQYSTVLVGIMCANTKECSETVKCHMCQIQTETTRQSTI